MTPVVWLARDGVGREVALELLTSPDPADHLRFQREADREGLQERGRAVLEVPPWDVGLLPDGAEAWIAAGRKRHSESAGQRSEVQRWAFGANAASRTHRFHSRVVSLDVAADGRALVGNVHQAVALASPDSPDELPGRTPFTEELRASLRGVAFVRRGGETFALAATTPQAADLRGELSLRHLDSFEPARASIRLPEWDTLAVSGDRRCLALGGRSGLEVYSVEQLFLER